MSKNLEGRLNQLKPYVTGIRFFEGVSLVDTRLKTGWNVPTSKVIKVGKLPEDPDFNMFYSEHEGVTLDDLLDFVDETIKINIEREKKFELLKVKVEELKKVFKDNSLVKLQNMKFVLGDSNIIPEAMPEDFLHENMSIEDLDEEPVIPSEYVEEPIQFIGETNPEYDVQQFNSKFKSQDIELPPKKGEKIQVETFEVPVSDGPCTHGPDSFCPKCMDSMDY